MDNHDILYDGRVNKYRNKHKRRRYCQYLKYNYISTHGWYTCEVKNRWLYDEASDKDKYKGMFCPTFRAKLLEIKEPKIEI